MKTIITLCFFILNLFILSGCAPKNSTNSPSSPMKEVNNTIVTGNEDNQEQVSVQTNSEREKLANKNSPWQGYIETEVVVKKYVELDPWLYAGEENDGEAIRTACLQKIADGIVDEQCPTNTILRIKRTDGKLFPKEINWSEYNTLENDIDELTIGCLGDDGWYLAPIRDFSGPTETVISSDAQAKLFTALDEEKPLTIRINKEAYDILGRGGTACDVFFSTLEVIK